MATREQKIRPDSVLERLIRLHGGSKAGAARSLGVTRQLFAEWCVRGYVPSRHALAVEEASGGAILAKHVVAEANAELEEMKSRKMTLLQEWARQRRLYA